MTHTQSVGLLWTGIGPSQRPLPDNTQHSQETDIHAPGGIGTCNTSKRAAADPRRTLSKRDEYRDRGARLLGMLSSCFNEIFTAFSYAG